MTNDKDSHVEHLGELLSQLDSTILTDNERAEILVEAYERITSQPTQSDAMREALERIKAATCNEIRAGDKGYVSRYGIHGIASAALQEQSK